MPPRFTKELDWLRKDRCSSLPNPASVSKKDVGRILSGEPVDYVIGWKPFLNCKIDLSEKPLIPRPETEFWTEQFIKIQRDMGNGKRKISILDMFAGSGCVGVAILKNIPNAYVDFADCDSRCMAQIKINLRNNHIAIARARVVRSDIFSRINGRYDAIVANPPYVPRKNKKILPKSVLDFEPHVAVFGGNDGLRYIRLLLKDAKLHLNTRGAIWMEFDTKEKSAIAVLAKKFGYGTCGFRKDQYGKIRYVILAG